MKKVIVVLGLLISSQFTRAQQFPVIGQYMFNKLFLNPAYAGTNEAFNANFLVRKQWFSVGGQQFNGAPTTAVLNFDAPIQNQKAGLGGTIYYDQLGVIKETFVAVNYSYRLPLSEELTLAMGLRAGVGYVSTNFSSNDLNIKDNDDANFNPDKNSEFAPKFGAGTYLYHPKFYVGLSVPDLVVYDKYSFYRYKDNVTSSDQRLTRNFILTGGVTLPLSDIASLQPNVLLKYYKSQPLFVDVNCNVLLKEKILFGASVRPFNSSMVFLAQLKVKDKTKIGFASEQKFPGSTVPYSAGTYEILVTFGIQ